MRWWKFTRPVVGLLIAAAVVAPWVIVLQKREPTFLKTAFWHDVVKRSAQPLEGHAGPPGYYLLTIWGTFFPWCILLPAAIPWAWRNRRIAPLRFALAAVIGPWILMEVVKTKLAHYILPAFPPLAFITADMLVRAIRGEIADLRRTAFLVMVGIWAAVVAALGVVPWLALRHFDNLPIASMVILTIAGVVYGLTTLVLFYRRNICAAAAAMGIGMIAIIGILYTLYLPRAQFLWLPQRIATVLHDQNATHSGDAIMIDYREDSLPYYQGGTIRGEENNYFTTHPPARWAKFVVLPRNLWERLPGPVRLRYEVISTLKGLAYARRGAIMEIVILRRID